MPFLDVPVDVLQHHDRIVHHQADRQHQRQQRQRVDGETGQRHERKGADQAHRDGDDRDDGGAHGAQEDKDHQRHQHDASTMVWNTLWIDLSMNTELSLAMSIEMPGGRSALSLGIMARTPGSAPAGWPWPGGSHRP
jgi:ABC-type Zn2+ transport system substrate-binding protein/surface adhesin